MTADRYKTPAWRAVRKQILERDGHLCQIQLPGRTTTATEGCHLIRPEDGGETYDPANLRAGCKSCNISERNRGVAQRARQQTASRDW